MLSLKQAKKIIPGLFLAFILAVFAKFGARFFPNLGAGTLAILIGIFSGNCFFHQKTWEVGTKWAEKRLLEISIVLLGMSATFQTITKIGIAGVLFILSQMTLTIIFVYMLGRLLSFNQNMSLLMAGGNAVCGSSAIGAIAPEIGAKDEEKGQIITLVNLLGTIMMLTLPIISTILYPENTMKQSALIGGTLQSVGQVIASASMVSSQTLEMATLFKILRIICLVFVVYFFSRFTQKTDSHQQRQIEKTLKSPFPWYIIGFIILCTLNSLLPIPSIIKESSHFISSWCEVTALAAIGLRINAKQFLKEGHRFIIYALAVGVIQIILAIILIFIFNP